MLLYLCLLYLLRNLVISSLVLLGSTKASNVVIGLKTKSQSLLTYPLSWEEIFLWKYLHLLGKLGKSHGFHMPACLGKMLQLESERHNM